MEIDAWRLLPDVLVGMIFGASITCLCVASRGADRELEEFERRIKDAGRF